MDSIIRLQAELANYRRDHETELGRVQSLGKQDPRKTKISEPQSITQKGVHAHPLTAREREHWFLQHSSHFLAANFGRQ